jgi:outer membrane protein OmpA-like peptidoglycan-associated protein
MRHLSILAVVTLLSASCGGNKAAAPTEPTQGAAAAGGEAAPAEPATAAGAAADADPDAQSNEFVLTDAQGNAKTAHGAGTTESKLKPTRTEAAMKFIVVDKEKGPVKGIVVALTAPDGKKYYTGETDSTGYAEVLVPVGKAYDLVFLSLGRTEIAAKVKVTDEPNQNVRLTLRYKRIMPPKPEVPRPAPEEPHFVLEGVTFDTGKASIRSESIPRLDAVVEYMTHKLSSTIEISGHTDNAGNPATNKKLSEKRAQACREYLISKGIDGSRITAIGYGDERPIAPNDTEAGRQQNRRIEATEL